MSNPVTYLLTILISLSLCESYKILVVFPFPARSHNNLGNGFVKHLLKTGHEVTYITPFPLKNTHPQLRQIDVSSNREAFSDSNVNINALMHKEVDMSDETFQFFAILEVVKKNFENDNIKKLLGDTNQQFDVVIAEWMFNEIYSGFAAVFDCPYIWSFPYEPHANIMNLIDEATNPAYIANLVSNNVPPFSFTERVQELWNQLISQGLKALYFTKYEIQLYEKAFSPFLAKRGRSLPSYQVMRYNASMMLGNSHVSLGQPVRLPQNFKFVGGFHIDDEVQPLPDDLQKIMDNAKHGVVYFSMGSNLKSKDLADEIKNGLIKMFGGLKQTVLWKFEEKYSKLPQNVHIVEWAPQQSILAHPNCILFITHGGLLSITETVHFGVPIIGIPVFTDQFNNVDRAVQKGIGSRVDISFSLANQLKAAITDIVNNQRYRQKAKELSVIYHDRPVTPGAELVHWVQHVVRTRGAPHLRSPALHVPLYQKLYLDLVALVLVIIFILIIAIKYTLATCSNKKLKIS